MVKDEAAVDVYVDMYDIFISVRVNARTCVCAYLREASALPVLPYRAIPGPQ